MFSSIQIFSSGKWVTYQGRPYQIAHNSIRGEDVFVYLEGLERPIHTKDLWVEPTIFDLRRKTKDG